MASAPLDFLVSRNPASGAELGRVSATRADDVPAVVARARAAGKRWASAGWEARRAFLKRWWKSLARDADAWADAIRAEVGKPRNEAFAGDVLATLDGLRWTVRHARGALAGGWMGPGHQRLLQIPAARVDYRPLGVVGVIGTWNYPLFLNAPVIAQALAAGNAVVWKPSELAPLCGERLQRGLEDAGLPDGLVSAVFGGPEVGRALTGAAIDKGVFTGGVENGRQVLGALAARGVPALAELSGFDAALVLADAPLESTARALAWGAFVGAGQTCVAIKRIYVVGDAAPLAAALAAHARALRIGDPARADVEIGPMISEAARDRFHATLRATVAAGATILHGGAPEPGPGWFYPPTVLRAGDSRPESALAGVFGPVAIVRGVRDVEAGVAAINASRHGLAASVWSRDLRAARSLAGRLDVGMVTINEVVTPTMHASAPFGGTKSSGFGRTHGPLGLREFSQTQAVFARRAGGFRPHLFPYGATSVDAFLRFYRRFFHGA